MTSAAINSAQTPRTNLSQDINIYERVDLPCTFVRTCPKPVVALRKGEKKSYSVANSITLLQQLLLLVCSVTERLVVEIGKLVDQSNWLCPPAFAELTLCVP